MTWWDTFRHTVRLMPGNLSGALVVGLGFTVMMWIALGWVSGLCMLAATLVAVFGSLAIAASVIHRERKTEGR